MSRRRDRYPLSLTVHGEHGQPPSCCPRAVTNGQPRSHGTPRYRRSAGQWASPGTVARFPSSRRGFDSRHPLHHQRPRLQIVLSHLWQRGDYKLIHRYSTSAARRGPGVGESVENKGVGNCVREGLDVADDPGGRCSGSARWWRRRPVRKPTDARGCFRQSDCRCWCNSRRPGLVGGVEGIEEVRADGSLPQRRDTRTCGAQDVADGRAW